jgi:hypothetical protein
MLPALHHPLQTSIVGISCFDESSGLDRALVNTAITVVTISQPAPASDAYANRTSGDRRDDYIHVPRVITQIKNGYIGRTRHTVLYPTAATDRHRNGASGMDG